MKASWVLGNTELFKNEIVLVELGWVKVVEVKFAEFALVPESNQGLDERMLGICMPSYGKRLWLCPPQSL